MVHWFITTLRADSNTAFMLNRFCWDVNVIEECCTTSWKKGILWGEHLSCLIQAWESAGCSFHLYGHFYRRRPLLSLFSPILPVCGWNVNQMCPVTWAEEWSTIERAPWNRGMICKAKRDSDNCWCQSFVCFLVFPSDSWAPLWQGSNPNQPQQLLVKHWLWIGLRVIRRIVLSS